MVDDERHERHLQLIYMLATPVVKAAGHTLPCPVCPVGVGLRRGAAGASVEQVHSCRLERYGLRGMLRHARMTSARLAMTMLPYRTVCEQ